MSIASQAGAEPRSNGRRAAGGSSACATRWALPARTRPRPRATVNGSCIASPSRNGGETIRLPCTCPSCVPLDQLLQDECEGCERPDERDLPRPADRVAAADDGEDGRHDAESHDGDAQRDRERRVLEVAVPARGEHMCALVRIRHGGSVADRMCGERPDHRKRHCDQPGEQAPHGVIVAQSRR